MADWFPPALLSQVAAGEGDPRFDLLPLINWALHFDPPMISIATKPPLVSIQ